VKRPGKDGMDPKLNIYQRLSAVMNEVDYIQKDKKQGMRYSIVSHDVVTAKVRPFLLKHGIVYPVSIKEHWQDGNMTGVLAEVSFVNVDDPQDRVVVQSMGYGIDDQDKGPGKAVSYAVKYALLKVLGLETGDDPDENQDAKKKEPEPSVDPMTLPAVQKVIDAFAAAGFPLALARDLTAKSVHGLSKKKKIPDAEWEAESVRRIKAGELDKFKPKAALDSGGAKVSDSDVDAAMKGAKAA